MKQLADFILHVLYGDATFNDHTRARMCLAIHPHAPRAAAAASDWLSVAELVSTDQSVADAGPPSNERPPPPPPPPVLVRAAPYPRYEQ